VSPEKVYRGLPLYVTWTVPSVRVNVPNVPEAPGPPFGVVPDATVRGGHAVAQAPVQALVVAVSELSLYRVMPEELTRMGPPILALETALATSVPAALVVADVPAGDAAVVVVAFEALGVDDPQAAAMRPTRATAPRAVMDRVAPWWSVGLGCEGINASVLIGGTSLRTVSPPDT
jgi:hypothetical protein